MSTTNALSNSFLRLGLVVLAAFLASCGRGGDGAAALAVRYFTAAGNGGKDFELRKTDGTEAGTVRVKEIKPGADSSRPFGFAVFNNAVYFSAFDGTSGFELWKSDGTEAGTVRVKDINPGAGGSSPFGFTVLNNTLYFSADDGTNGFELWKSDGTEAGTVRVKDISRVNIPYDTGGRSHSRNQAGDRPRCLLSFETCLSAPEAPSPIFETTER